MDTKTKLDIRVLKALADERRLAAVELLSDGGERCVCVLAETLGMSEALVSHHVGKLRDAGLVETRRAGRWLHVRLRAEAFEDLGRALGSLAETGTAGPSCCSPQ